MRVKATHHGCGQHDGHIIVVTLLWSMLSLSLRCCGGVMLCDEHKVLLLSCCCCCCINVNIEGGGRQEGKGEGDALMDALTSMSALREVEGRKGQG